MKKLMFISIALILSGCQTLSPPKNTSTLWVNGETKPCWGMAKMQCLQVVEGETLSSKPKWQNFYAPIDGFIFKDNIQQKIIVQKTIMNTSKIPADASNIRYRLIQVVQTQPMPYNTIENLPQNITRINDIWAVTHLFNKVIRQPKNQSIPTIEFHSNQKKVMGTDGCNHFTGTLTMLDEHKLKFGMITSTRKMCVDMTIIPQFHQAITEVASYHIDELTLILRDKYNKEVIRLKKVD